MNSKRRSFLCKAGASVSAVFASTVAGIGKPGAEGNLTLKEQVKQLSGRLVNLEDENAIRELHRAYGTYLDRGLHGDIVDLFTDDGQVVFNGVVFTGKEHGVRRLYMDYFGEGATGEFAGPVHGRLLDHTQQQDVIKIARDGNTATARFHCFMLTRVPLDPNTPYLDMARLQGLDIKQWWEIGIYHNNYMKDGVAWKIKRLEYRPAGETNYSRDWFGNRPGVARPFSNTYPEDPVGPDRLITADADYQEHR